MAACGNEQSFGKDYTLMLAAVMSVTTCKVIRTLKAEGCSFKDLPSLLSICSSLPRSVLSITKLCTCMVQKLPFVNRALAALDSNGARKRNEEKICMINHTSPHLVRAN